MGHVLFCVAGRSAVEEEEEEEEGNKNKSKKKPPTINVGEATIRRMSRTESAAVHCRTVSELSETDGSSKGFPGGNSSSGEGSPIADHVTGQYESNRALSSPNSSAVGTFDLFVSNNVGDVRPARGNLISPRLKGLSFSSTTSLPGADSGTPSMGPATEVDEWLGCIGNGMAQYSLIFRRNAIETLDLLVECQFPNKPRQENRLSTGSFIHQFIHLIFIFASRHRRGAHTLQITLWFQHPQDITVFLHEAFCFLDVGASRKYSSPSSLLSLSLLTLCLSGLPQ
jgi:hypothetical protein